ncbi:MAG: class I SAM-dependent methyltransferase [Planctomycetes bacterium]|nr:class I SAM-dependent methyltransferase [Planctomycetota bacterium]
MEAFQRKTHNWQCPACRVKLEGNIELKCPHCGKSVVRDGRVLDFTSLTPDLPLHMYAYLRYLYEEAGEVEPDIAFGSRINRAMMTISSELTGDSCLEIGPADGVMTSGVEEIFTHVYALDCSIRFAKRLEERTQKTKCLVGDAHFLPFPDQSIDCIVCTEVLEHVLVPTQFLLEIRRVLSTTGLCYLTVPNVRTRIFGPLELKQVKRAGDAHINFFNLYGLQMLLFRTGFELISIRTLFSPDHTLRGMWRLAKYLIRRGVTGEIIECLIRPSSDPRAYWNSMDAIHQELRKTK